MHTTTLPRQSSPPSTAMIIESPDIKTPSDVQSPTPGSSAQPPPYSQRPANASGSGSGSSITTPVTTHNASSTSIQRPKLNSTTTIFSRQPSQNVAYPTFKPMFLVALGKYLNKGFLRVIPPSHEHPHPFVGHDIGDEEWLSFLDEILEAGLLTAKDEQKATHLSFIGAIPIVNMVISHGIRSYLKSKKVDSVVQIIDRWNHHFFRPRRTEIILLKGTTKLSGLTGPIGDLHTPPPVDVSGLGTAYTEAIAQPVNIYDIGKYRGREGQEKDLTYRLFVVPLSIS